MAIVKPRLPLKPETPLVLGAFNSRALCRIGWGRGLRVKRKRGELYDETVGALRKLGHPVTENADNAVVYSKELVDALETTTKGRSEIPLKHLRNSGQVRDYLRPLAATNGWIVVHKANPQRRREAVQIKIFAVNKPAFTQAIYLFSRLGLFPSFRVKGKTVAMTFSGPELAKLMESGVLADKHLKDLRRSLRKAGETRVSPKVRQKRHYHPDDVETALSLLERRIPPERIARHTGIEEATIENWRAGQIPAAARRVALHYDHAARNDFPLAHFSKWRLTLERGGPKTTPPPKTTDKTSGLKVRAIWRSILKRVGALLKTNFFYIHLQRRLKELNAINRH